MARGYMTPITPNEIAERALADFLKKQPSQQELLSWYQERSQELQNTHTENILTEALRLLCQKLEERHLAQ